jgi:aminoglycoside phosphotransferase (APT) family kinase protein
VHADERRKFAAVVAAVEPGARLVDARPFPGGLSALMTVLEVEGSDGLASRLVVRQVRDAQKERRSLALGHEFRLLVALRTFGLPVPSPRLFDDSGTIFDHPYCVLEYVEGSHRVESSDPAATGRLFATQLAAIHRVDGARPELSALPARTEKVGRVLVHPPDHLDDSLDEGTVRRHLLSRWPPPEPDRPVLLHGDFWVGNLLWRGDEIVAVIDWEDASTGDPLTDVATTRLDLLWAFGPQSMAAFTDHYLTLTGRSSTGLALWDLVAALRPAGILSAWGADWIAFGRPDITAVTLRTDHRWFLDQALAAL